MKDEPTTLAAQIMQHYGAEAQKDILIEECAELIQAVEKSRRGILTEDKPAYTYAVQKSGAIWLSSSTRSTR